MSLSTMTPAPDPCDAHSLVGCSSPEGNHHAAGKRTEGVCTFSPPRRILVPWYTEAGPYSPACGDVDLQLSHSSFTSFSLDRMAYRGNLCLVLMGLFWWVFILFCFVAFDFEAGSHCSSGWPGASVCTKLALNSKRSPASASCVLVLKMCATTSSQV